MARFVFARRLIFAVACVAAPGQPLVELEAFGLRKPPDLLPSLAGSKVTVRGVVSAEPVRIWEYYLLPLQNDRGAGITLDFPRRSLPALKPGDYIEARGEADHRAGLPVVRPEQVTVLGTRAVPKPQPMSIEEVSRPESLGRVVVVESTVGFAGRNAGGDVIFFAGGDSPVTVFLPRNGPADPGLGSFRSGDQVQVAGISTQYDPIAPHDGHYQIAIGNPAAVKLLSRPRSSVSVSFLAPLLGLLGGAFGLWWYRERRMSARHRVLRGIVKLSEHVLEAGSHRDILARVRKELPSLVGASSVAMYLFESAEEVLQPVANGDRDAVYPIPVSTALGSTSGAVALCFRNRSLLRIPDARNSPILDRTQQGLPRAAVCVPMITQREVIGVLAVYLKSRTRRHNADQDVALQHLGNQIAAVVKLNEQRQMREQLLRSEKMAAAGQLISAIATDLRAPTENIIRAARQAGANNGLYPEMEAIAREAGRVLDIIDHVLSFARMEQRQARPLDLHALVSDLIQVREEDARRKSVKYENQLPVAPAQILADRSQLEQALLTVLITAEHAAARSPDRCVRVASRVLGRRILLTFDVRRPMAQSQPSGLGDYLGFPVAQAVFSTHGGELRHVSEEKGGLKIEIDVPVHEPSSGSAAPRAENPARVLTCLLVEPDGQSERRLLALLSSRGHRAIPVARAEDAAEMVQRMQFEVMFCASRLPGLNWVEMFHRVRRRVGKFVLIHETRDPETLRTLEPAGDVLLRPVEERELDEILSSLDAAVAERGA